MEIMFYFLHSSSISQYFEVIMLINLSLKCKIIQWKTELAPALLNQLLVSLPAKSNVTN